MANHFHAELPESIHVVNYTRDESHESGRSRVNYTAQHHSTHSVVTRSTVMQGHHQGRDRRPVAAYSAPIETLHHFDHKTRTVIRSERSAGFKMHSTGPPTPNESNNRRGSVHSPPLPTLTGQSSLVLQATRAATPVARIDASAALMTVSTTTPSPHVMHHASGRRRRTVPTRDGATRVVASHGLTVDTSGAGGSLWISDEQRARIHTQHLDSLVEAALHTEDNDERTAAFQDLLLFLEVRRDQYEACVRTVKQGLPRTEDEKKEWKLLVAAVLNRGTSEALMLSLQLLERVLRMQTEVQVEMIPLNLHVLVHMHQFARPTLDFLLAFKVLIPMLDAVESQLREGVLLAWGSVLRNFEATQEDPARLEEEVDELASRAQQLCDANDTSATVAPPCEAELTLLANILANVGTDQAFNMVLGLLSHRSPDVRGHAILSAASYPSRRSLSAVTRALAHDGHPEVQRVVLHALRIMATVSPADAIAALDHSLHNCMHPTNITTQQSFCKAIVETATEIAKEDPSLQPKVEAMEKTLHFAFVGSRMRRSPSLRGLTLVDEMFGSERSNNRVYGTNECVSCDYIYIYKCMWVCIFFLFVAKRLCTPPHAPPHTHRTVTPLMQPC